MKKGFCFLILQIVLSSTLYSIENYPAGARSKALSNAFVSVSDTWSTFHNQAGLAGLESFSAGFYYESRFMIDELSLAAGALIIPVKAGTFGLSFSQFGKGSYKEHKIGLAFAKKLTKKLNAAIQIDYLSERFPENANSIGFGTFEIGVIYAVNNNLFLGAHVFNPILGGIKTPEGVQKMPAVVRIGGHYQFPRMVLLSIETEKDTENPFVFKSGLEFSPVRNFALRFGVSGKPVTYTAGLGFQTGKISIDLCFGYHGNLGITPSASVQFKL